ncbi:ATP synthase F1 subunit gamma [Cryomorpha ignava]|uniref:ATP synthase gamma chain n=1 Tax=Cryomorpha ignava TaxID=101383 RepID=A0A7K3WV43_9FLAO|nr:ATP synthase F1 subunit gamma [Cryomorpha ignava]NEN24545.1 ATP synthase F1 subunit gamma [Cryomorpha ignava]
MANLKEIRSRITSVNSTRQITAAMKMVSAAKLRRAQDAITQMRPYAEKLQEILQNLSSALDVSENPYAAQREVKRILIVSITSNRGLCGAFNNNVIKQAKTIIAQNPGARIQVLSIGKKSFDVFKKTDYAPGVGYPTEAYKIYEDLNFADASSIAECVMDKFEAGKLDKVYLVYNSFRNAAIQILETEQFLPIVPPEASSESTSQIDYIFEPNKEEIVTELIPKSLKTQFYKAILDSNAGEHGARMTAMHKATDNATDMLKDLKLTYNKARQASITNEILEIVAGAEALNG